MRKICVFSGKRGGWGAFLPIMQLIDKDPDLELQIVLSDMHPSGKFGKTKNEVQAFFPHVPIKIIDMGTGKGDKRITRAENVAVAMFKAAKTLETIEPDILLIHADRGEQLAMAFAALNFNIPIAHTQGGEVSGNIDDIQRHAITKLAHLHFPETELAAKNIQKMGEEAWRIHTVGSVYIDRIVKKMYTPTPEAKKKYGLGPEEKYFIVLFHPETLEGRLTNNEWMRTILSAVKEFGLKSIVVYPCSDPGYEGVIGAIEEVNGSSQFLIYKNINNLDFLGLMAGAEAMIGNSSAVFSEAPYFPLAAVNIGKRQLGREREENIIDSSVDPKELKNNINYVLTNKKFKENLAKCGYRRGDGRASERIVSVLKSVPLDKKLLAKKLSFI